MSKKFYEYYRILGVIDVDSNKWDEYGSDIYLGIILSSINGILSKAGFEEIDLPKKIFYKENDLKQKIMILFDELEEFTKINDIYPVLVWKRNGINIELRQKVEKLNIDPNDSNKIFKMLNKLMEGKG